MAGTPKDKVGKGESSAPPADVQEASSSDVKHVSDLAGVPEDVVQAQQQAYDQAVALRDEMQSLIDQGYGVVKREEEPDGTVICDVTDPEGNSSEYVYDPNTKTLTEA